MNWLSSPLKLHSAEEYKQIPYYRLFSRRLQHSIGQFYERSPWLTLVDQTSITTHQKSNATTILMECQEATSSNFLMGSDYIDQSLRAHPPA
jgi:hypothetical protein